MVYGEISILGQTLAAGKTIRLEVTPGMPMFEVKPRGAKTINDGEKDIYARVVASDCFEPPLEMQAEWRNKTLNTNIPLMSYSKDFLEKMGLVRTSLDLSSGHLKSIMVVGDRKTGKSTLLNYLSFCIGNSSSMVGHIYLLETDLGQPLQSIPGFVSLRILDPKLLSNDSAWRGQSQPLTIACKFIGDYSGEQYSTMVEEKVSELFTIAKEKGLRGTLLINTSGFVRGVGLTGLNRLVELLSPQIIVEMGGRNDSVVKGLSQPRRFNHIRTKGDFINSKTSVFHVESPVPAKFKLNSARDTRNAAMLIFFEEHTVKLSLTSDRIQLWIVSQIGKRRSNLSLPEMALLLVGSVGAIQLEDGSEGPVLFEDADLAKQTIILRIQPELLPYVPSTQVRLFKSEHMALEAVLGGWRSEVEEEETLGKRILWTGPSLGVGARPLRRKVSTRKWG